MVVRVARVAPPGARRAAAQPATVGLERPPWSAARPAVAPPRSAANVAAVEAPPTVPAAVIAASAAPAAVVETPSREGAAADTRPAVPAGMVSTRWTAIPTDDPPPWSAEDGSCTPPAAARRLAEPGSPWTPGPALARNALIGLVCLVAVLGFTKGVTIARTVHLAGGGARPTLTAYRQLRAGQSCEQVDALFGDGLGLDGSAADAHVHRSYGDGTRLDLWFSGGVLQGFSEHGLSEGASLRVYETSGTGPRLFALAGGLAEAAAWWLLLCLVAPWRGHRLSPRRLAVLAGAGLAVGLATAFLLPALLGFAVGFAVFLALLVRWTRRDVAEALIIAAVVVAGGSLALFLAGQLGSQLSLLLAH